MSASLARSPTTNVLLIGDAALDVTVASSELPRPDELRWGKLPVDWGGSSVYCARALRALRSDYRITLMIPAAGQWGASLQRGLGEEGIEVVPLPCAPTLSAILAFENGDRGFLADDPMKPLNELPQPPDASYDMVVVSGYFQAVCLHSAAFLPWFDAVVDTTPRPFCALDSNYNTAAAAEAFWVLRGLATRVDCFFPNLAELGLLSGLGPELPADTGSVADAARRLRSLWELPDDRPTMVATAGEAGCFVCGPGGEPVHMPAQAVRGDVFANSAGDVFLASFLAAPGQMEPGARAQHANRLAAEAIRVRGFDEKLDVLRRAAQ
ncbi:MAG: carbohydrate kinase family protein [Armatimonadota bacterium]|jgi:sugar/nucleoside kinase (ribokinase family)